jgi:hypothetical protein
MLGKTLTDRVGSNDGPFECGNEQCRCTKGDKFTDCFSNYMHMKIRCITDIITVGNLLILHIC